MKTLSYERHQIGLPILALSACVAVLIVFLALWYTWPLPRSSEALGEDSGRPVAISAARDAQEDVNSVWVLWATPSRSAFLQSVPLGQGGKSDTSAILFKELRPTRLRAAPVQMDSDNEGRPAILWHQAPGKAHIDFLDLMGEPLGEPVECDVRGANVVDIAVYEQGSGYLLWRGISGEVAIQHFAQGACHKASGSWLPTEQMIENSDGNGVEFAGIAGASLTRLYLGLRVPEKGYLELLSLDPAAQKVVEISPSAQLIDSSNRKNTGVALAIAVSSNGNIGVLWQVSEMRDIRLWEVPERTLGKELKGLRSYNLWPDENEGSRNAVDLTFDRFNQISVLWDDERGSASIRTFDGSLKPLSRTRFKMVDSPSS